MAAKWYLRLCALPPLLLLATLVWLQGLEGWGAWAAAGALQAITASSAAMGLLGIGLSLWTKRKGGRVIPLLLGTLLSGSVAVFVFWMAG